jgi:hypothetical protein
MDLRPGHHCSSFLARLLPDGITRLIFRCFRAAFGPLFV